MNARWRAAVRAGAPSDSAGRADALYKQGNEAFKKGDLEAARTAYREAYALRQSFDIAGNLGAVEFQLGAYRDAAEHLAASLRAAPVNGSPESKAKMAKLLADAKARVATLVVTTSEPGADVGDGAAQREFTAMKSASRRLPAINASRLPTTMNVVVAPSACRNSFSPSIPARQARRVVAMRPKLRLAPSSAYGPK